MGAFAVVLPLLPHIIRGVEGIFGAKKGKKKKEAAVSAVANIIKIARDEGIIPEEGDISDVSELIEMTLNLMKQEGTLVEEGKEQGGRRVSIVGVIKDIENEA